MRGSSEMLLASSMGILVAVARGKKGGKGSEEGTVHVLFEAASYL